jgi:hypothetical protein
VRAREALCILAVCILCSLNYSNIGDSIAVALAEALAQNTAIHTVRRVLAAVNVSDSRAVCSLNGNNIGDAGAGALSEALVRNTSVLVLE